MSSPDGQVAREVGQSRKRDRPPALQIPSSSTGSDQAPRNESNRGTYDSPSQELSVGMFSAEGAVIAAESTMSRSCSATSSLDPYYFGLQSPSDSPPPPLPAPIHLNATPDMQPNYEPPTPAKDPATIDRRGLVGVGELSTPRWDRAPQAIAEDGPDDGDDYELILPEDTESGVPDSPWTIEAIDGESAGEDEPIQHPMPRRLRSRRSATDESGGEEILYPRKALRPDQSKYSNSPDRLEESRPPLLPPVDTSPSESPLIASPPSSFGTPLRKAKKRTSDEFEMDNFGVPIPKRLGSSSGLPKDRSRDDKVAARKHRSLTSGSVSGVSGRRDSAGLPSMSSTKPVPGAAGLPDRHTRQASGSSSSSNHGEGINNRRVYTADFSHLPPSPSSSSIQHFLKHASTASNANPPVRPSSREHQVLPSPNVAHSLLRGTQEGWSYLDDEATAEALRKLDGLTGKSARARASSSFGRPASLSRPGTPGKNSSQWEGIGFVEPSKVVRRSSTNTKERASGGRELEDSDQAPRTRGLGLVADMVPNHDEHLGSAVVSSDDQLAPSIVEKTPKKSNNIHVRSSFTPKRGSASSTTYTGTPTTTTSSRDSTSLSTTTSLTSVSTSGRHSIGKAKRNSAGSDISSIHSSDATSLKDRVASLALSGEALEDEPVPPVPPLPKDLSTYRSPPASAVTYAFPAPSLGDDKRASRDSDDDRAAPVDSPLISNPTSPGSHVPSHQSPSHSAAPQPDPGPAIHKTPSKKWSFSALNIKLSSSPSSSSKSSNFLLSPRAVTFGHQLRKSASKDQALSPSSVAPNNTWTAVQPEAMASVTSLASVSSTNSTRASRSPTLAPLPTNVKTPEGRVRSRSGTDSSASTHHTSSILALAPPPASPTPSVRRANSSKRLTPSSIPFFRRSSSQSIYIPPSAPTAAPSSPTPSSGPSSSRPHATGSPTRDPSLAQSVPVSARKKSSVLSLGLPSLLKSSSRRSLHAEKNDPSKDVRDHRKADEVERDIEKSDKDKPKKDDKDRSDSRISVLMGRKRGKTLSSTDPKKLKPQNLPPMQMSALPPATAQRVANLKPAPSISAPIVTPNAARSTSSSRLTTQTMSSMQKQSDASLRGRTQLPTIAGSPSVGANNPQSSKTVSRDIHSSSLLNSVGSLPKDTPTKIPRISSRTSAISTPPPPKNSSLLVRRASVNTAGTEPSPTPGSIPLDEFGVMENGDNPAPKGAPPLAGQLQNTTRSSPSTVTRTRQTAAISSTSGSFLHRKSNRDSSSFAGLRKASSGSVASIVSVPSTDSHRFSALSPSKGLKLLSPKVNLSSSRITNSLLSKNVHQAIGSPSSSRQSLSTPSPGPNSIDEEELLGDEEMLHYIRRQQAKKMATGATQEELDELLRFPEPLGPGRPSSPASVLKSVQVQHLSEYERKEILDYPSIYCIGANSKKKLATPESSSSNFGYDDERGDYLVIPHDHLAYRYEIIDTLGKGSFGQVLHCRDHCSGESVAIKIIRNKKRFHHQALVEIKILDNLRKWDLEEKHHVIKMTEHFYFRNHLCIAMELLSINLYELIKANGFVGFTTTLIRRFTSQMLLSLSLMRHHRIVHCDLKPENVLLRHPAKSALKVIDFGSSCFEHEKIYTYIQSRFYRSPEVILGMNYHMAIDMWSLGCILAELYTGFPIFPGENEQEQLSCIMEVLGIPDKEFINRSSRKRLFFNSNGAPRTVVNSKGRRRRPGTKTLAQVLRCNDEDFVDFISKCLVWDPERRIKPQAALRHPFIATGQPKVPNTPGTVKSTSRSKPMETPKKSQISAPTPLTARSSRTTSLFPSTPSSSSVHATTLGSSSRSYRSSQPQGLPSYHSSRTLNGLATTAK